MFLSSTGLKTVPTSPCLNLLEENPYTGKFREWVVIHKRDKILLVDLLTVISKQGSSLLYISSGSCGMVVKWVSVVSN